MARLPVPGQDDGTWGEVLNSFLEVSHNSDGSLQSSAIQTAGGITSINGKNPSNGVVSLAAGDVGAAANPMTAPGDMIVGDSSGTPSRLAGNTTASLEFLTQIGTGSASAAPAWKQLFNYRGGIAASTTYNPGDTVIFGGQVVLVTKTVTTGAWTTWYSPPTLSTGTYIPISRVNVYHAEDWPGFVNDGATDNWLPIQTALLDVWLNGGNVGILMLPKGWIVTGKTVIVPPNCVLAGASMGANGTTLTLAANANCDVVQTMVNYSASQYALLNPICGISQGSLRNAFYAGITNLTLHGNYSKQSPSAYYHCLNVGVNPTSSQAGTDPDYDPTNWVHNVEFRYASGDGFYQAAGRSQIRVTNTLSHYNQGNGYTTDTDSIFMGINAGANGICGFYNQHSSCIVTGAKSYENGTNAQWTSGGNYSAMQSVIYSGQMYRAINALTNDTVAPSSDSTNWTHVTAASSPQAWGYGAYISSTTGTDLAWSAIDLQDNYGSALYIGGGAGPLAIQASVSWPNFNGGTSTSNPNGYAALVMDGCHGCIVDLTMLQMGSSQGNAYALRVINGSTHNDVRLADDGTTATVLSPDSIALVGSGNSVKFNGSYLSNSVAAAFTTTSGGVSVGSVGSGLSVAEGSNAKQGTATLTAGVATVANTSVTANSRIMLTSQIDGGTPGFLRVSARVAGTSFTITSSSASDTSTVAYEIFEPA